MNILVTGGNGFIGSNFIRYLLNTTDCTVINVDRMTYAGVNLIDDPRHIFYQCDIGDPEISSILGRHTPTHIVNFAAETHVDRSINDPLSFVNTNIVSTYKFISSVHQYSQKVPGVRFIHISTDEVYGQLKLEDPPFTEHSVYEPNSPYSATKASADHLVRAFQHTYGLPAITVHMSNNYGPYQFPEKLIPVAIIKALHDKPIPVYGDGMNIRDWLFVGDACAGVFSVMMNGVLGRKYNIGGLNERNNLNVVTSILYLLNKPLSLLEYVEDRKGHDFRYALDISYIQRTLGWTPTTTFEDGLVYTINWYSQNMDWVTSCVNLESF